MVLHKWENTIPPYYPTMYLGGYTVEQILYAAHKKMYQDIEARKKENEAIKTINIKVNI